MIFMIQVQTLSVFIGTTVLIYSFYFLLTVFQFSLYLILLSERPKQDVSLLWLMPVFPFFTFGIRVWSAVAILNEWLNKGHLDSAMAPWWVLKKDKY